MGLKNKRAYFRVLLEKLYFQDGIADTCHFSCFYQGQEIVGIMRNFWLLSIFRMLTAFNQ